MKQIIRGGYLLVYYIVTFNLPSSTIPLIGKIAGKFRTFLCRKLFYSFGNNSSIQKRVYIGSGSNISIGKGAIIAAGSVVTKAVLDYAILG